jgi:hypothetical protein
LREDSNIYCRPSADVKEADEEIPRPDLNYPNARTLAASNPRAQYVKPFAVNDEMIQPGLFNNGRPVMAIYNGPGGEVRIPKKAMKDENFVIVNDGKLVITGDNEEYCQCTSSQKDHQNKCKKCGKFKLQDERTTVGQVIDTTHKWWKG